MKFSHLRPMRFYDTDEGGVPGAVVEPPIVEEPVTPPVAVAPVQPVAPALTEAQVQEFLKARNVVAIPQADAAALQVQRQQQREAERIARKEQLTELAWKDPGEFAQEVQADATKHAVEIVDQRMNAQREIPSLITGIVNNIKKELPNLPQADIDEIMNDLSSPNVTAEALRHPQAATTVLSHAKSKMLDRLLSGDVTLRPNQRPANEPNGEPGTKVAAPAIADPVKQSALEKMAASIGVPPEQLAASYKKQQGK